MNLRIDSFLISNLEKLDDRGIKQIRKVASTEFKFVLSQLKQRLSKINQVEFLTETLILKLTKHFEDQRKFQVSNDKNVDFETFSYLKSEDRERDHLQGVSVCLIRFLFPPEYSKTKLFNIIARDVLTNLVLYPTIDTVSHPDFINTRLLSFSRKYVGDTPASTPHSPSGRQTPSLGVGDDLCMENILMLINLAHESQDEATLRQVLKMLKQKIAAIDNLSDVDDEHDVDPDHHHWSDIMTELTTAKTTCHLKLEEISLEDDHDLDGVELWKIVMDSSRGRKILESFLQGSEGESVLVMFEDIEALRDTKKCYLQQLGTNIFFTHLNCPRPSLILNKTLIEQVESFLRANSDHRVFYEIQCKAATKLESFSEQFLQSELFLNARSELIKTYLNRERTSKIDETESPVVVNNNSFKGRIDCIENQIVRKQEAQETLQNHGRLENTKLLQLISEDLVSLQSEKNDLVRLMEQTESWTSNLGHWQCRVQEIKDQIILVVFIPQERLRDCQGPTSWIVTRSLVEIVNLQRKLSPYFPWLADLELPTANKTIFGKLSDNTSGAENSDRTKVLVQRFLESILDDDIVCGSEAVYSFFCSFSQDKEELLVKKDSFKNLKSLFRTSTKDDIPGQDLIIEEGEDSPDKVGDFIADPLYALLSEIFDLKGVFKWFRKSLVTFVQISFGRTISRQLVDTANMVVSETMIITYLNMFKNSIWSNGQLRPEARVRTEEDMIKTRAEAREMIVSQVFPYLITSKVILNKYIYKIAGARYDDKVGGTNSSEARHGEDIRQFPREDTEQTFAVHNPPLSTGETDSGTKYKCKLNQPDINSSYAIKLMLRLENKPIKLTDCRDF